MDKPTIRAAAKFATAVAVVSTLLSSLPSLANANLARDSAYARPRPTIRAAAKFAAAFAVMSGWLSSFPSLTNADLARRYHDQRPDLEPDAGGGQCSGESRKGLGGIGGDGDSREASRDAACVGEGLEDEDRRGRGPRRARRGRG